jgi:hypothetical protein
MMMIRWQRRREGGREEEEEEACKHTRLFIHYPDTQYARIS